MLPFDDVIMKRPVMQKVCLCHGMTSSGFSTIQLSIHSRKCNCHVTNVMSGWHWLNHRPHIPNWNNFLQQMFCFIHARWYKYTSVYWVTINSADILSTVRTAVWCQAITWTNASLMSIRPFEAIYWEISNIVPDFFFKNMHFKMSSTKFSSFSSDFKVSFASLGRRIGNGVWWWLS